MKKLIVVLFTLFITFVLLSCNSEQHQPTATPVPTPSPTPVLTTAAPTQTAKPSLAPSPTPSDLSFTTGLPFEGDYKPVIAIIENLSSVRPQTGLQTADVVYEVPVESSITRFVCVFSDNVPEKIMPVRSARVPFIYIQHEWNAVFMHFGGSGDTYDHNDYSFYGHELYGDLKYDVDGLKGKWKDYFYRAENIDAPHNVVANPFKAQKLYDYKPQPLGWLFDTNVVYPGDTVSEIKLALCSTDEDYVSYTYDAKTNSYLRFMDGKPFTSAETGNQVSVKNLIVQYSTYHVSYKIKLWNLIGEGKADFYIAGKMIKGSWKRETADSKTIYYDGNGKQIVLLPGNTWIELCPQK